MRAFKVVRKDKGDLISATLPKRFALTYRTRNRERPKVPLAAAWRSLDAAIAFIERSKSLGSRAKYEIWRAECEEILPAKYVADHLRGGAECTDLQLKRRILWVEIVFSKIMRARKKHTT